MDLEKELLKRGVRVSPDQSFSSKNVNYVLEKFCRDCKKEGCERIYSSEENVNQINKEYSSSFMNIQYDDSKKITVCRFYIDKYGFSTPNPSVSGLFKMIELIENEKYG